MTQPTPGRSRRAREGSPDAAGSPPGSAPRHGVPRDAVGAKDRRHLRSLPSATFRRRRLVVGLLALLVVGSIVMMAAFVWPGFAYSGDGAATPEQTVTAQSPTPTASPIARAEGTAFAKALPASVLRFALTAEAAEPTWSDAGALEAYRLTYADGPTASATAITVTAGQWPTDDDATTAAADLVAAAGEPSSTGDVEVGDAVGGEFSVIPGDADTATIIWRNGTAVLRATGPADAVRQLYDAYPM